MSGKMWTRIRNEKCGIDPDATSISVFFELGKIKFCKSIKGTSDFFVKVKSLDVFELLFLSKAELSSMTCK